MEQNSKQCIYLSRYIDTSVEVFYSKIHGHSYKKNIAYYAKLILISVRVTEKLQAIRNQKVWQDINA